MMSCTDYHQCMQSCYEQGGPPDTYSGPTMYVDPCWAMCVGYSFWGYGCCMDYAYCPVGFECRSDSDCADTSDGVCTPIGADDDWTPETVCEMLSEDACNSREDSDWKGLGIECESDTCVEDPNGNCDPACVNGESCCDDGEGGYYCQPPPCIPPGGGCPTEPCEGGQCCCYDEEAAGNVSCQECPCGGGNGDGDDEDCQTCPRETCLISWTSCKGDSSGVGVETQCSRCIAVPPGTCAAINGMAVNPNCGKNHGPFTEEEWNNDACLTGGRYTAVVKTDGGCDNCCTVDCEDYPKLPSCSSCCTSDDINGTSFACGLYGFSTGGATDPGSGWQWIKDGCCLGYDKSSLERCTECDFGSSCASCDSCNDLDSDPNCTDCTPADCAKRCLGINSLNDVGLSCSRLNDGQVCIPKESGCVDCTAGPECNGVCPPAFGTDCCWHCACTPSDFATCNNGTQKKCCRCGNFDCETGKCDPIPGQDCPDGMPQQDIGPTGMPSDCYCSGCTCNGGICNGVSAELTCGCPGSWFDGSGYQSYVRLPDGECIWMMCQQPYCLWPDCNQD